MQGPERCSTYGATFPALVRQCVLILLQFSYNLLCLFVDDILIECNIGLEVLTTFLHVFDHLTSELSAGSNIIYQWAYIFASNRGPLHL